MRVLLPILLYICSAMAIMFVKWNYPMTGTYSDRMIYGSSPAIADLQVNSIGGEPNDWLEIVVGSDEVNSPYDDFYGAWRCIDAMGALEWYLITRTDEARSSPAIGDFNGSGGAGDAIPDIAAGTTSGWSVEAFSNTGSFIWRFGKVDGSGKYLWHSSPAIADVVSAIPGKEIVIGNSNADCAGIFCLEGDISDGSDNGYAGYDSWAHSCWDTYIGTDGTDWDVLWFRDTYGAIISSPAVGDIDNDGTNEILIGTGWVQRWFGGATDTPEGRILCINGQNGSIEWFILTGGSPGQVPASPAIADIDGDGDMEIFIGAADGYFYCIDGDEDHTSSIAFWEMATVPIDGIFYSSPAVGDVDGDGQYEIIVGDENGNIHCLFYNPAADTVYWEWQTHISDSAIISSPALCVENDSIPWSHFRHDAARTGFYPPTGRSEHIFVGTLDGYLVHLRGNGSEIERIRLGKNIVTSPAIADIDKDCYLDITIVSADIMAGELDNLDTLWCIGTDIKSGLPGCDECDTMDVSVICPQPCFQYSSCDDQIILFGIRYDIGDSLDTMEVFLSYVIEDSSGGITEGELHEPTDIIDFTFISPDSAYLIVHLCDPFFTDGDRVIVTMDSLFSYSDCKTVP